MQTIAQEPKHNGKNKTFSFFGVLVHKSGELALSAAEFSHARMMSIAHARSLSLSNDPSFPTYSPPKHFSKK